MKFFSPPCSFILMGNNPTSRHLIASLHFLCYKANLYSFSLWRGKDENSVPVTDTFQVIPQPLWNSKRSYCILATHLQKGKLIHMFANHPNSCYFNLHLPPQKAQEDQGPGLSCFPHWFQPRAKSLLHGQRSINICQCEQKSTTYHLWL